MPTLLQAHPLPPEVALSLLRARPPHRDLAVFLHDLALARAEAPEVADRAAHLLVETTREGGLADAYLWIVRLIGQLPAPRLAEVAERLRVAWAAPEPLQARVLDRIDALMEVARLRDDRQITPLAVGLVHRLLDPVRVRTLRPENMEREGALLGELRAARDLFHVEAPTTWRLVGADLDRHLALFEAQR